MTPYAQMIHDWMVEAKAVHAVEKQATIRSVQLVGELDKWHASYNYGNTARFAAQIGLTEDQYLKRAQAARVLRKFPQALPMLEQGDIQVSHLGMVAPKITEANAEMIFAGIKGKKRKEIEAFLSTVNPDGTVKDIEGTMTFQLTLTVSQVKALDRAREVLSAGGRVPRLEEIFIKAMGDLLEKRDPVRKAERAKARAEKQKVDLAAARQRSPACARREAVPAAVRHEVWQRDEGQCTFRYPDDTRCCERAMLELDHVIPWARGGKNTVENLRLRCRRHNIHGQSWYSEDHLCLNGLEKYARRSPRCQSEAGALQQ